MGGQEVTAIKKNDKVKLSALFLRSIGGFDKHAETVGTVKKIDDGWLAHVAFGKQLRKVNVGNLVKLEDVSREVREAETNVRGVHIGRITRAGIFGRFD